MGDQQKTVYMSQPVHARYGLPEFGSQRRSVYVNCDNFDYQKRRKKMPLPKPIPINERQDRWRVSSDHIFIIVTVLQIIYLRFSKTVFKNCLATNL